MSNPATSFEPYRRRLLGLAYRMLGSMADAEDAVQETYVRWHGADRAKVLEPRAFLMTTTTRICLDLLTSARARREEYVGPWLPEPVVDTPGMSKRVDLDVARGPAPGFVGVVHGPAGVHFIAVAQQLDELWPRLSAYVRAWAPFQLNPETEEEVRGALTRGDDMAAVKLYFSQPGRWEAEVLLVHALAEDGTAACYAPDQTFADVAGPTAWRSMTARDTRYRRCAHPPASR
jgi:hypothetical protein